SFTDAVGPATPLVARLAARHAVGPPDPSRARRSDLGSGAPLVVTVVPLLEVVSDLGLIPGQPSGVERALERARQDLGELPTPQAPPQLLGLETAGLGQGNIGAAG